MLSVVFSCWVSMWSWNCWQGMFKFIRPAARDTWINNNGVYINININSLINCSWRVVRVLLDRSRIRKSGPDVCLLAFFFLKVESLCVFVCVVNYWSVFLHFEKIWFPLNPSLHLKVIILQVLELLKHPSVLKYSSLRQKEHCPAFVSQSQLLLSVRGIKGNDSQCPPWILQYNHTVAFG